MSVSNLIELIKVEIGELTLHEATRKGKAIIGRSLLMTAEQHCIFELICYKSINQKHIDLNVLK